MNFHIDIAGYRLTHTQNSQTGFDWWLENKDGEGMSMSDYDVFEMFDNYFKSNF